MSDEIPLIPVVPPKLREASLRGTLIPFVGAGASRLAGCPTWAQFADRALQAFVDGGKFSYGQLDQIRHLNPRVKLSIAQGLQVEHGLPINYADLIDPVGGYSNEVGRRLYQALAQLGQTFVTTNYDTWLDTEPASSKPPSVSAGQQLTPPVTPKSRRVFTDPNDFTPANLNQPKTVFHLHGSLTDPSSMVVTTRDYVTRYANDRRADAASENRALTFLDHLFTNKNVLFVGYGVEELEILEYVIQKGQMLPEGTDAEAKHFMLQGFYAHEYELMRSLTQYYRQCDIQLLPFRKDQRDWHQLLEVLDDFAKVIPAGELVNLQKLKEMESFLDE
jgi:SIR2-like domain